jgi:hypothetical protein
MGCFSGLDDIEYSPPAVTNFHDFASELAPSNHAKAKANAARIQYLLVHKNRLTRQRKHELWNLQRSKRRCRPHKLTTRSLTATQVYARERPRVNGRFVKMTTSEKQKLLATLPMMVSQNN